MEHKAFDFYWNLFEKELLPILQIALNRKDSELLINFIKLNLEYISDPYEGAPLVDDWHDELTLLPIQDIADYALTKYYSVENQLGLGDSWIDISDNLSKKEVDALLGHAFDNFDPGCYGSYFQSIDELKRNSALLSKVKNPIIESYIDDLSKVSKGLYVTF
jgi:hypothetical protein